MSIPIITNYIFVRQTVAKNSSSLHFFKDIFREKSWIIHWLIILLEIIILCSYHFTLNYLVEFSKLFSKTLWKCIIVYIHSGANKAKMIIKRKQTEGWCFWSSRRKWQWIIQEGKQNYLKACFCNISRKRQIGWQIKIDFA